jgi:AmmeMemoRadiSam system protein B
MSEPRPPAVAGLFYPAEPALLRATVDDLVGAARRDADAVRVGRPRALIAPHAGYAYSGPIAASAYACIDGGIERVVILGPAHRVRLHGLAVASVDAFRTPLGDLVVDTDTRDDLVRRGLVSVDDRAHADEHSLEVHLPFVQVVLGDVLVLPIVVGDASPAQVADVLDVVWDGPETLVVVSTDLSHYHDQVTAQERDRRTAAAIVDRDETVIWPYDACGSAPLRGLLVTARRRDLTVTLLDLRTSADTAGGPDRVVGYGSFALA